MGKRFGRNQRRQLRERAESAERVMAAVKTVYRDILQENAALKARLRKSIEIDVDVLRDHSKMLWDARIEAHREGYHDGLYLVQRIDDREAHLVREKERFIQHVSTAMAHKLMRAIGERWS